MVVNTVRDDLRDRETMWKSEYKFVRPGLLARFGTHDAAQPHCAPGLKRHQGVGSVDPDPFFEAGARAGPSRELRI